MDRSVAFVNLGERKNQVVHASGFQTAAAALGTAPAVIALAVEADDTTRL